jgi:hypothetical protein
MNKIKFKEPNVYYIRNYTVSVILPKLNQKELCNLVVLLSKLGFTQVTCPVQYLYLKFYFAIPAHLKYRKVSH